MLAMLVLILKYILEFLNAIWRDLQAIKKMIIVRLIISKFEKDNSNTSERFSQFVKKHPNKACIIFNDETWTFQQVEDYANQIARLFQDKFQLKKGDCVALFLENKPEYICIWLGLSKLGVISALINTNLRNQSLLHSINVAKAKFVIFDSTLESAIETIQQDLAEKSIQLIIQGGESKSKTTKPLNLDSVLSDISTEYIHIEESNKSGPNDVALYIYTSGTTGLPKPAVIKNSRLYGGSSGFFRIADLDASSDIVMCSLPIYHANGTMLGVGSAICSGATCVLRKKFSASNFWKECIQYKCTVIIYVGEICRFLVNQPPSDLDRAHSVRIAIGNGMRKNVWEEFNTRFGNIKCIEFYAASEGNCTLINFVSKTGACGFFPLLNFIKRIYPVTLIKIDEQMRPIRDSRGYCIECKVGEKGLLIGMIGKVATAQYNGYANNTEASNSKIIDNVFAKGQRAFNSGDLMVCDWLGYMYFCDRLGDTFRWRGENVATCEVENVISKHLNSAEVVVYGVEIPGQEGKAGMAAISTKDVNFFESLSQQLKVDLPAYAKPLFIRLMSKLEHTGTFKAIKNTLVEEGYNIKKLKDKIYYFDSKDGRYMEMTNTIYENILNCNIRL